MKLEISTKLKVPILFYPTEIIYKETRQPSGIEYILLTLISDDERKTLGTTIGAELENLNIPKILHQLFYETIQKFIAESTVNISEQTVQEKFTEDYDEEVFEKFTFKDINLTPKGKELFYKKYILTGDNKNKSLSLYFFPMLGNVDIECTSRYKMVDDEYYQKKDHFSQEFFDRIIKDLNQEIIKTKIDDCIYKNKNSKYIKLKQFDEILEIKSGQFQYGHINPDNNLTLCIENNEVKFSFKTQKETDYFYKYYSASIMNTQLQAKARFQFFVQQDKKILARKVAIEKLSNNIKNYYLPEEINAKAKQSCRFFLNRENLTINNGNSSKLNIQISNHILDMLDMLEFPAETQESNSQENTEQQLNHFVQFALLSQSTLTYYSAVNAIIPCSKLNDVCEIPLLVEHSAPKELYNQVIQEIYNCYYQETFEESRDIIAFCIESLNEQSLWERYITCQLKKQQEESSKIFLFSKMDDYFNKKALWNTVSKKWAEKLWNDIFSSITLDNLSLKINNLKSLKKYINISDSGYIAKIIECFPNTKQEELYVALEKCKFNPKDILSQVNIISMYMEKILEHESIKSLPDSLFIFKTLDTNFWKLNDLLGIKDYEKYTIKQDYNFQEFKNAYQTLRSIKYQQYETFAHEQFSKLEKYMKIYEPIFEFFAMEELAESNPKNIKQEYITKLIEQGKFKESICSLLIKVQYDLKEYWKAQNNKEIPDNANDIINLAYKESLIDKKQKNALHQLRTYRNEFQHPSSKSNGPTCSSKGIEKWRDIIFALETSLKEKLAEDAKKKEEAKKQEESKKKEEKGKK